MKAEIEQLLGNVTHGSPHSSWMAVEKCKMQSLRKFAYWRTSNQVANRETDYARWLKMFCIVKLVLWTRWGQNCNVLSRLLLWMDFIGKVGRGVEMNKKGKMHKVNPQEGISRSLPWADCCLSLGAESWIWVLLATALLRPIELLENPGLLSRSDSPHGHGAFRWSLLIPLTVFLEQCVI